MGIRFEGDHPFKNILEWQDGQRRDNVKAYIFTDQLDPNLNTSGYQASSFEIDLKGTRRYTIHTIPADEEKYIALYDAASPDAIAPISIRKTVYPKAGLEGILVDFAEKFHGRFYHVSKPPPPAIGI